MIGRLNEFHEKAEHGTRRQIFLLSFLIQMPGLSEPRVATGRILNQSFRPAHRDWWWITQAAIQIRSVECMGRSLPLSVLIRSHGLNGRGKWKMGNCGVIGEPGNEYYN